MMDQKKLIFIALATLIILGGVFARFWKLDTLPPGVHYDEAYNGLDALKANETGDYKIFYPENTGREGLHINAIALSLKVFGNTNFGLRVPNAIWGSLTILGFFFLLQILKFSRFSVLAGTFMLSFSFWHLDFSRLAYRAIMVPFCLVWIFYFLFLGLSQKEKLWRYIFFALSGIFLGLGFYTYIAFRVAPLILVILLGYLIFSQKNFLRRNWKGVSLFALALIIAVLPMVFYFFSHEKEVMSRAASVSVFNAPGMSFSQALGRSLGSHLGAFFIRGDNNARQNYNSQPLLPIGLATLFAMGVVISFREIYGFFRQKKRTYLTDASVLAQSVFWIMLLPGVLSIEGIPHSLRIIGTIPAVYIFCVLPLEYVLEFYRGFRGGAINEEGRKRMGALLAGLVFVVVLSGFSQAYTYFALWARDLRTYGGFERKLYDLGELINDLPARKNNYLITSFNTAISSDHKKSSLKTVEYLAYPKINQYSFYRPNEDTSFVSCDDPQIVFQESDAWLRDQYKGKCPNLKAERFSYEKGKYVFWVISTDPSKIILEEEGGVMMDDGSTQLGN